MTRSWDNDRRLTVARASRRLTEAAYQADLASGDMIGAGRSERFGLPADIRKAAGLLRDLAKACLAEIAEGEA